MLCILMKIYLETTLFHKKEKEITSIYNLLVKFESIQSLITGQLSCLDFILVCCLVSTWFSFVFLNPQKGHTSGKTTGSTSMSTGTSNICGYLSSQNCISLLSLISTCSIFMSISMVISTAPYCHVMWRWWCILNL